MSKHADREENENKMKKQAIFLSCFFFIMAAVFGVCGIFVIRGAYVNEIHTVQNLAGRVIAKYPETEKVFLEALGDMERKDRDTGAQILALYGYDEQEKIKENKSYRQQADFLQMYLSVFLAAAFLWICAFCYTFNRKKKRQEEQILSILDDCLSGRYGFLDKEELLSGINNPFFADTLVKLGKSLKLKSQKLDEEHDNTKTLVTDISHQLRTPSVR